MTETDIKVHDDLISERGLNTIQKRKLWIAKFNLRWLKTKRIEFNDNIKKILWEKYVLYYVENANKLGESS